MPKLRSNYIKTPNIRKLFI